MNITLAQVNTRIGDFEFNTQKIVEIIKDAKKEKVDLVIFPELAVCGYPPKDLLETKEFIEKSQKSINDILLHTAEIAVIVGCPSTSNNKTDKKIYNSAYVLDNGLIKCIINKTSLSNYDIFDESRYFDSNSKFEIVEIKGTPIAITIGEDISCDQPLYFPFRKTQRCKINPLEELVKSNPSIIINISATPFSIGEENKKKEQFRHIASKYSIPIVNVNLVGSNGEIIFYGGSLVLNHSSDTVLELKHFSEDTQFFSLSNLNKLNKSQNSQPTPLIKIRQALVLGIRDFFAKNNFSKAVIGLSGGLDSAVVAALTVESLGNKNVTCLLMPSQFSSEHSVVDAVQLSKNLSVEYHIIPIYSIFDNYCKSMQPIFKDLPFGVAEENLQARIRGTILMTYSNKFGHIVLNCSNKSEFAVGYSTMYGDMNGALSVIGDIYKTEVYSLANQINMGKEIIPTNIITKPPSAELRPNQKDTDSLPNYDLLDKILFNYIEKQMSERDIIDLGFEADEVIKTIRLVNLSEYKRFQAPPILRVSQKAFGSGRRIPIVAKFK